MPATTSRLVRLRIELYHDLRDLAHERGATMQEILADALSAYRREQFWNRTNAAYAALRADPEAWAAELEERALWDRTVGDGLQDDVYEDERLTRTPSDTMTERAEA